MPIRQNHYHLLLFCTCRSFSAFSFFNDFSKCRNYVRLFNEQKTPGRANSILKAYMKYSVVNSKALGYGLGDPDLIPDVGGVEIFLHSFVSSVLLGSAQPPIKWVPGGKGGRAYDWPTYLFLVPWLCICGPLHPHSPWAIVACNGDTFTYTFYLWII